MGQGRDQLDYPTSVLVTATKDLIICDRDNRRIQWWPHQSIYGETLISDVACLKLFTDHNGEIMFSTNQNELFKWNPAENRTDLVMEAAGKNPPKSSSNMFLSRNGNIYVADAENNRILKYRPGQDDADIVAGGQAWQSSDLNHLNKPKSVIVDDKGTLYIADEGNNRIVRWRSGDTQGVILSHQSYTSVLNFDRNGNLFSASFNHVERCDIDTSACGKFLNVSEARMHSSKPPTFEYAVLAGDKIEALLPENVPTIG